MSAVISSPEVVTAVKVEATPRGVGGSAVSLLPRRRLTPNSSSCRRSSLHRIAVLPGKNVVNRVDDGHRLIRPRRLDFAAQLEPDRPRAKEQDPIGLDELGPSIGDLGLGDSRVVDVHLGWERVCRTRSENDVVGRDAFAGTEGDGIGVDSYCPVVDHLAAAEQAGIWIEDAIRPFRVDEPTQRGDVVYECVLRLDENYVSYVVKGFGGGCPSVPATDDCYCCQLFTAPLLSSWHVRYVPRTN
jgi:hypothetical protein